MGTDGSFNYVNIVERMDSVIEGLKDIGNVAQVLGMSLQVSEEDEHIIRSVAVIDKMVATVVAEMEALKKEMESNRV